MMVDTHCGGCGRELTKDEQLRLGWSCVDCEMAWQQTLAKLKQQLQSGDE